MKKFFLVFVIIAAICAKSDAWAAAGDYCISNGVNCWWCAEGGDSGTYCDRGYAGCMNTDQIVIYNGGTIMGTDGLMRECTVLGFCYVSCSWVPDEDIQYRYISLSNGIAQVESNNNGCQCRDWGRIGDIGTGGYVCEPGYYGTPDTLGVSGCTRCPSYTNAAGETFYGNSDAPFNNTSIGSCWLDGSNGPFSDTTGIYDITTDKCMYIPTTIVVPVDPVPGGEITPALPGGGTIVTPAN